MRKFYEILGNPDGSCDVIIPEAVKATCETGEDWGIKLYIIRDVEKTDGLEHDIREHYDNWKAIAEVIEI